MILDRIKQRQRIRKITLLGMPVHVRVYPLTELNKLQIENMSDDKAKQFLCEQFFCPNTGDKIFTLDILNNVMATPDLLAILDKFREVNNTPSIDIEKFEKN